MRNPSNHIFDHTPDSLRAWCNSRGMPPFRAGQILDWVYVKSVADPAKMLNLSKRDRELLADPSDGMTFLSGEVIGHQLATDGTQKLLVQWEDFAARDRDAQTKPGGAKSSYTNGLHTAPDRESTGGAAISLPTLGSSLHASTPHASRLDSSRQTECVMIPTEDRKTACISSQVGCPVGCRFCASGIGGLDANLSAGRIVEQVWLLREALRANASERRNSDTHSAPSTQHSAPSTQHAISPPRISNIVFMGMGEPLSNFQNVVRAVHTLNAPWAFNISARRITISTVGLPKAIEKLAEELDLPVTLALSLHAPNDDIRRQLIPWAEYTTIPDLLAACQKWFEKTGREITLEYIVLGNVNDRPEHARQLADFAKTIRANVNLIRYNEVKGMPYSRPDDDAVLTFQQILRDRGVNTHIRASRGRDIAAACGQLRHESSKAAIVPAA